MRHIHTEYSDGSISVFDVIKSVQDAGLDFCDIVRPQYFLWSEVTVLLLKEINLSPSFYTGNIDKSLILLSFLLNTIHISGAIKW